MKNRFIDQNLHPGAFSDKILVVCPKCSLKAEVISQEDKDAILTCYNCHFVANKPNLSNENRFSATTDYWFGQKLWLQVSFKNELLWFHNYEHMDYVKNYIQAGIRERNNREYFILVEKLPQFIKSAKNRDKLLNLIEKLERK
jgi:Zn-finger protein